MSGTVRYRGDGDGEWAVVEVAPLPPAELALELRYMASESFGLSRLYFGDGERGAIETVDMAGDEPPEITPTADVFTSIGPPICLALP